MELPYAVTWFVQGDSELQNMPLFYTGAVLYDALLLLL
jgi:hypothetical protein